MLIQEVSEHCQVIEYTSAQHNQKSADCISVWPKCDLYLFSSGYLWLHMYVSYICIIQTHLLLALVVCSLIRYNEHSWTHPIVPCLLQQTPGDCQVSSSGATVQPKLYVLVIFSS